MFFKTFTFWIMQIILHSSQRQHMAEPCWPRCKLAFSQQLLLNNVEKGIKI